MESPNKDLMLIKKKLAEFVNERNWHSYHTPKNLILSLSAEVGELMQHFLWKTDEEIMDVMTDEKKE
ncbi:MAG: hypothetical protein HY860_04240 [Chlamydiales bacterium]|nr:hypothetical protein [Chlamydiales bacterium]